MANKTNLAYVVQPAKKQQVAQPYIQKSGAKKSTYIKPYKEILLILATALALSFLIFSMVQLNEVSSEIQQAESDLRLAQSENVRLNTALESQMSLQSVADYAEQNLGLTKMGTNQVNYISVSEGNAIEIPGEESGWLTSLQAGISDFLEYLSA